MPVNTVATKSIMLVDDDAVTRALIQRQLADAGYNVICAESAEHAQTLLKRRGLPHLFVIDLRLTGMSGDDFARALRAQTEAPIVMLTSVDNLETKIRAIQEYADDYIIKPHRERDLVHRIERILRRIPHFDYLRRQVFHVTEAFKIHQDGEHVEVGGRVVSLTPVEYQLLQLFMRNPNRVLTHQTLERHIWQHEPPASQSLRVHIHRLRGKIQQDVSAPVQLQTERGLGYRLAVDDPQRMAFVSGIARSTPSVVQ